MNMKPRGSVSELGFLRLDGRKRSPLFLQLYESVREAILQGTLRPGCRIPSSRDLMEQLGVSRTTVVTALDRLAAEGYLQSMRGSGTFVSRELPDDGPFVSGRPAPDKWKTTTESTKPRGKSQQISELGKRLGSVHQVNFVTGTPEPFCPGEPALDAFPVDVWSRIVRSTWKKVNAFDLSYGEPAGQFGLRKSIAEYLRSHRGVKCETRQVMIVNGTQQAVDIIARILINPGDHVLFEDPGYVSAREAISKHGGRIVSMGVDEHGAMIEESLRRAPAAKLAYVTPSHQYPLGVTMPIERRLELLAWAAKSDGWILEDDYDSEYRYAQQPIPSMQGLDASGSTFYVGSFSKVVFPALGLGYVIVPSDLVEIFESALSLASRPASQIDQLVLSRFIHEGHFGRHLRRMRKIHAERRQVFVDTLEAKLSHKLTIVGSQAGLHCTALLKSKKSDSRVVEELYQAGIITRALSDYYAPNTEVGPRLKGLVFGFACATPNQIRKCLSLAAEII